MLDKIDYNPDVLTCLANLSNDEVFTPPELVNDILDLLPKEIFKNKETIFLDPVTKSGVFLREIAKRLMNGLEDEIPDKQERINHIFKNQLYGIAITELTSLLARRSVYCSKKANSKYSICDDFETDQGNILFERIEHTWKGDKCKYCGVNKVNYSRGDELETHAYQFIHTDNPKEVFNMKFDVIIGNPPYQLNDGGGTGSSAMPIYQKFIEQAKKLNPRYLTMITPSRWFSGGRGLDDFRNTMLNDDRIRSIHDYPSSGDCFPGVSIEGGVNYFLWDRDNKGKCQISTHEGNDIVSQSERDLLEKNAVTFIRYNESIPILRKIQSFDEGSFSKIISANDPFGFDVRKANSYKRIKPTFKVKPFTNSVEFYYNGWRDKGLGYVKREDIRKGIGWVDKYKIYISKAYGSGKGNPYKVINTPFFSENSSCSTETYLVIGPFDKKDEVDHVMQYISTKLFRFLVFLTKSTQNAMKGVYQFVPMQDFSENWTDEKLYKKYGLDEKEIVFIESMIRPMELDNE